MMSSWTSVTVGVADLDHALDFWVNSFGFEVQGRKEGQDLDLAQLWDIQPGDIARQALLKTPGETTGMMHLVEFNNPDPPVREGAQVFDLCPKNLDIYVNDLPLRHPKASGSVKSTCLRMMQSMSYCWNWLAMNCHSASRASLVLGL
jgi:catechol 2,3-dioxygenase-like lactoylglutathione lyase family enzyme